jgi:hypothetical protein
MFTTTSFADRARENRDQLNKAMVETGLRYKSLPTDTDPWTLRIAYDEAKAAWDSYHHFLAECNGVEWHGGYYLP